MPYSTEEEVDRYVGTVVPRAQQRRAQDVESYWVAISKLYLQVNAHEKAELYLNEYLEVVPQDVEVAMKFPYLSCSRHCSFLLELRNCRAITPRLSSITIGSAIAYHLIMHNPI
jgi:hypothetical protein